MHQFKLIRVLTIAFVISNLAACSGGSKTGGDYAPLAASSASSPRSDFYASMQELAVKGNADAQLSVARMYAEGNEVPKDIRAAIEWASKAGEQGNLVAQAYVATLYLSNAKAPFDYEMAFQWTRRAAEGGQPTAQWLLADEYYHGLGTQKDITEAAKWYRKAADQGIADAQDAMGDLYWDGITVPQDYVRAAEWYRKAAEQGHAHAQLNLSMAYFSLRVLPKNPGNHTVGEAHIVAAMWSILAKANGNEEAADLLANIERRMSAQEIAEAQARARAWWENHHATNQQADG